MTKKSSQKNADLMWSCREFSKRHLYLHITLSAILLTKVVSGYDHNLLTYTELTRMALSRAYTSAQAADPAKLLHFKQTNRWLPRVAGNPPNRNHNLA